ncbi:MAG: glycoside hydrolase family 5 protein [Planctomycetes bacterium]|nr:glycoside hydrolase family 5 protein [Planctomycetota bacterium]
MAIGKHYVTAMIVIGLTALGHGMETAVKPRPGLSVQNGVLTLAGKPYYGMGANYFSLFSRTLKEPSDNSYDAGLKRLSDAHIPFVRFMACAFWPAEWDLYLQDKAAYFKRLDGVVRCAEKCQIGLIPSLFWHMATVPDLVSEPMDQYGNPESRTIAFVQQYTREVVLRYRASPAIWGWEFGNEYNLAVDLPNASEHRPPVVPQLKTALHRTSRDELSSEAMLCVLHAFATTVRQHDAHRILITGHAMPRPSAYHNTLNRTWTRDSDAQFETILLRDNPAPFDMLSVHVYARAKPDYPGTVKNVAELIGSIQSVSTQTQKPLFIGEFGASRTLGQDAERSAFSALVKTIEQNGIPLSAFWVYDYPGQKDDWNVTWDNERRYMLSLVSEANQHLNALPQNTGTPGSKP